MADLIGTQGTLRVLDLEDSEVMVLLVELLHTTHVNLVLQLGDTEILDLDRVSDGPLETNRYRRKVISVLDELQLSATVQSLTFKANSDRLAIHNLEEDTQVVLTNLFGIVEHVKVHLLTRCERATTRLDLKDVLVEDLLLKGLLLTRSARVSPRLHLDL